MKTRIAALLPLVMFALAFLCAGPPLLVAQDAAADQAKAEPADSAHQKGETFTVPAGATETVADIMERDARLPLGALSVAVAPGFTRTSGRNEGVAAPMAQLPPAALSGASSGLGPLSFAPQTPGTSFLGIQLSESTFVPAQSMGAAGPSQILVAASGRIKVFDKAGVLGGLNTTTENFFASVGGVIRGVASVQISYDRLSQRWFVIAIDVGKPTPLCPNNMLLAVSSGPVITDATSFTFSSFQGEPGRYVLVPGLGVDRSALYIGVDTFDTAALGCPAPATAQQATGFVVNKASVLLGTPTVTAFRNLLSAASGMLEPQGADNDDPASTEGYFIGVDVNVFDLLVLRRVNTPGGTPTISGDLLLPVSPTRFPIAQPQPAPGPTLGATDDRLFTASVRKNKITGLNTLWASHNIGVAATCVAGAAASTRNASRWYEITTLTGAPTLRQSGTLCDTAAAGAFGYWMPTVNMSGQGHMAIAASRASTNAVTGFASVAAAGRLRGDALGSTQAPTLLQGSTFGYNPAGATPKLWGDYSQTVVDPSDDQSMWTFQEYANAVNSWGVRVTRLLAPLPALPASAVPASVFEGQSSLNVTLTGTSAAGTEFFDPGPDAGGPGYPNHVAATVSGGVTVNTTGFTDITHLALNISTVGATPGPQDVTVINPDGQSRTGIGVLTVLACPVVAIDPPTVPDATINSLYSVTFSQTGGVAPATFGLAGTLPSGLTFDVPTATLSGTPTQIGTFNFTVTATDTNGCPGNRPYTLVVNCQAITVNPATIASGTAGTFYTQTFTQTGTFLQSPGFGTPTVVWSVTGALPAGLTLDPATGVLSGTPTQTGSFPITITATDGNTCSGSTSYTLVIACQSITVDPPTIATATAGTFYTQTFTQTNAIGTVTWSVTGTLPAGVTLDSASGVLSGTPTQTGSFPIAVTATDGNLCPGSQSYTLVVDCQTITVDPATIPAATAGTLYSQTFTQTNAIGTVTWSVTGTLPTGVTLDSATGVLSGTPTETGSFPITVTATDGNLCPGSQSYTLVVNCQVITVGPATIAAGIAGSSYSQTFTQTSGLGTITWSLTGTLPTGLSFDTATGVLSGTPTQTGSFPITVIASDGNLCTGSQSYTLVVDCQTITVDPPTIASGQPNVPYTQTFTQTSAIGTVVWSVTGTLPTGITLDTATGVLSGTTAQTGTFPITITATDGNLCVGSQSYSLVIGCGAITVDPATIPAGTAGAVYSQVFTQTGGTGSVTWSLTGTLPAGLTFDAPTATLSGTPTQIGSFPITVTATDSNLCAGSQPYTLVVNRAAPFASTALAADTAGNSVFEPGETVVVAPTWRNDTGAADTVTAAATAYTGPAGPTYTIVDGTADYGAVAVGATASCTTSGDCYSFTVSAPTTRPALHWDGTFLETLSNTDAKTWTLHVGESFTDVPLSNGYYRFVETILHRGITGGCDGSSYCPLDAALREQMAVFVLVAKEGAGYTPAACTTPIFTDVPASSPYCRYIEELSRRGVVAGCGGSSYCPLDAVTREQMSVFALRTLDPALDPPACTTPIFNDVPASSPFCRWIEELSRRGVVSGCGGGSYCPSSPVSREQMSVFITVTFGLTLYGQ